MATLHKQNFIQQQVKINLSHTHQAAHTQIDPSTRDSIREKVDDFYMNPPIIEHNLPINKHQPATDTEKKLLDEFHDKHPEISLPDNYIETALNENNETIIADSNLTTEN